MHYLQTLYAKLEITLDLRVRKRFCLADNCKQVSKIDEVTTFRARASPTTEDV